VQASSEKSPARTGRTPRPARVRRVLAAIASAAMFAALAVGVAGCGQTQDAHAVSGSWKVLVEKWQFAKTQPLGTPQMFKLVISNVDTSAVPQLIVTIDGMSEYVQQPGAASKTRPVWIPDNVNYSDVTPYNSATATSYNLGVLPAGATKVYKIPVTPIRRGQHTVSYRLAGNLYGSAKVTTPNGNPAADSRVIAIDPTPKFDESVFN